MLVQEGTTGTPRLTPCFAPCREAIGLVCEAVPGAKGAVRRRKVRLGLGSCWWECFGVLGAGSQPSWQCLGALMAPMAQLEWW